MTIKMQDFSEIVYGGGVTFAEWWDNKRIKAGTLTKSDIVKKAGTWVYLGVGLVATLSSSFGWWRKQEIVMEKLSTGFLYALPGFIYHTIQDTKTTQGAGRTRSDAVAEAQRILEQRRSVAMLAAGRGATGQVTERTYQPEFESAIAI